MPTSLQVAATTTCISDGQETELECGGKEADLVKRLSVFSQSHSVLEEGRGRRITGEYECAYGG